jgi:hypothetical protein
VDCRAKTKRYTISGWSILAATLLVSATAHAASSTVVNCDQVSRDLKSLEVTADALQADAVDHTPTDPDAIDEQAAVTDAVAPILDLTPRVTNIIRDVFGTTNEEPVQESPQQPATSPVADTVENSDAVEADDAENEKNDLPRFQRQMFRTDI